MLRLWKWMEGHMPQAVGSSRSWKRQARKHILPQNFEEGHSPADTLMLAQGDPFWISELPSQVCYSSKRKRIHQRRTTYVVLYSSQMWLLSRITWRVLKMLMPGLNFYFIGLEGGLDIGILKVLQVSQRCNQGGGSLAQGVNFGIRSTWLPSHHPPWDDRACEQVSDLASSSHG